MSNENYDKQLKKLIKIYKNAMKEYENYFNVKGLKVDSIEKMIKKLEKIKSGDVKTQVKELFLSYIELNEGFINLPFASDENFILDMQSEIDEMILIISKWDRKDQLLSLYELEEAYSNDDFVTDFKINLDSKEEQLEFVAKLLMHYYDYDKSKTTKQKGKEQNLESSYSSSGGESLVFFNYILSKEEPYSFIRIFLEDGPLECNQIEFFREAVFKEQADDHLRNHDSIIEGSHYKVKKANTKTLFKDYVNEVIGALEDELLINKYTGGSLFHFYTKELLKKIKEYKELNYAQ
jgi:hypothetical protein